MGKCNLRVLKTIKQIPMFGIDFSDFLNARRLIEIGVWFRGCIDFRGPV